VSSLKTDKLSVAWDEASAWEIGVTSLQQKRSLTVSAITPIELFEWNVNDIKKSGPAPDANSESRLEEYFPIIWMLSDQSW